MLPRSAVFALTFLATVAAGAAAPMRPAPSAEAQVSRSAPRVKHDAPAPSARAIDAATIDRAALRDNVAAMQPMPSLPAASVAESPQQAVIAALLRGDDARAAIASARALQPETPKAAAGESGGAFAGYVQARRTLQT
ncbi:hypothetical protein, partial [Tahibacter caeni]|uniref:hypothetical protein n=1 Tax=Tahibacter caeni TaxID=1453545 RepID=UPI003CCE1C78